MRDSQIFIGDISIETARQVYCGSNVDDDLMLFDKLGQLPIPNKPRRMRCKFFALCTHGSIHYSVDTEMHTVKANDMIIVNEGQVAGDYLFSGDCNGIAIMVSEKFFGEIVKDVHELSQLFLFTRTHPVCHITPQETSMLLNYFRMLKQKIDDQGHHFRRELVRSLLMTMIYDMSNVIFRIQSVSDRRQTRAEAIFTQFLQLVEANFRTERRVSWYAKQLCISPKYLSETVKQVSRRTPNEWIDNYVALEIRVLLRNTTKSIKEIANDMSFPNQSFFGRFFKEHVGMSPSEYRRK
ncbi:MAG: helix-turn-helix domain-containing protein [Prevotella sp.]|nr:helix-turn-helix domain-containing protein [Prevotella sp.]